MTAAEEMFDRHLRCERAIDAARRFLSRSQQTAIGKSDVVAFLVRRREQLNESEAAYVAAEAVDRWARGMGRSGRRRPRR